MHSNTNPRCFRRTRIFLVAFALVLLSAVCVGGVSGATWYVPDDGSLADVVSRAGSGDTIVITENYVITKQVVLNRINNQKVKTITITNAPGVDVTISSGLGSLPDYNDYNRIDALTLFKVHAGTLIVKGNPEGGSLTITTDLSGRAFDVNYDTVSGSDSKSATLEIHDGVRIYKCGFSTGDVARSNNGGAVFVRTDGTLIMKGGLLSENKAGSGGAVYVEGGGKFVLDGGAITLNYALNTDGNHDKWGGGVWVNRNSGTFNWNGGVINGNTASSAPAGDLNYHEVWPNYNPPAVPESPNNPAPNYPIYVVSSTGVTEDGYETIKGAYEDAARKYNEFTIYIKQDFPQTYIEEKEGNGFIYYLDAVTVESGKTVYMKPASASLTLHVIGQMFVVKPGGSLIISGNDGAVFTISGTLEDGATETGGFVLIDGGSFTLQDGAVISSTKAQNGGAIYIKSGSCTLSGGSITGCSASENGAAVYVDDGKFTVSGSSSLAASNDVYLDDGEVITVASGYTGSIGKITLHDYVDGRNVVDVTAYPAVSISKFVLNEKAHEKVDKVLVLTTENNKQYLELRSQVEFTIIIPDKLVIPEDTKTGTLTLTPQVLRILDTGRVDVSVESKYNFNLAYVGNDAAQISYELMKKDGTRIEQNSVVAGFTLANSDAVSLTATLTGHPPFVGSYTDILTFTAEYIDPTFA